MEELDKFMITHKSLIKQLRIEREQEENKLIEDLRNKYINLFLANKIKFIYTSDGNLDRKYSLKMFEVVNHFISWCKEEFDIDYRNVDQFKLYKIFRSSAFLGEDFDNAWYGVKVQ